MALQDYNPFAKHESISKARLIWYKALTILSWLLIVIVSIVYHSHHPGADYSIWHQNKTEPFALNMTITDIYWLVLLILQGGYIWHLFSDNESWRTAAGNVAPYFILNNLMYFGFIMCLVRSFFWPGELILVANFFNLTTLYCLHPRTPRFIHIPVVSGPLAFNFVVLFWNGGHPVGTTVRAIIAAQVFIWLFLVYGVFYLWTFKDYTLGFELAILTISLAVKQMAGKWFDLQWIFAWVIAGVLLLLSLAISVPGIFGKEFTFRREGDVASTDRERQPLLDDE